MSTATDLLPLSRSVAPADPQELAGHVREAYEAGTPLYPIGGGTSLDFGLPAKKPGIGLELAGLNRVVDYPARDMTITVEAGISMAELARTLQREGQWLPIDAAQAERATLGGVIATNFSGPRRYGNGTIRDYVIGITAVDGRGVTFHGGGRVVKNVAGYDFCKLLCGSLGTLAVIAEVTLKLKPRPAASALVACSLPDWDFAEKLLGALVNSRTTPAAIELVAGPAWHNDPALEPLPSAIGHLLVGLEGTAAEVEWMTAELRSEWSALGVGESRVMAGEDAAALWTRLTEFPASGSGAVLKANIRPSATTGYIEQLLEADPEASIQAHAGNGIVLTRTSNRAPAELTQAILKKLQPAATAGGGNLVVLAGPEGVEPTRRVIWGSAPESAALMQAVKDQFDPRGLLNPGRFLYWRS